MKISLFKLHQYLFSDWADLSKATPPDLIAKMAAPKKATTEAKKKEAPADVEAIKKRLIDKRRKEITEFFFGKKPIETLPDSEKSQLRAALRALGAKHLEEVFFGNTTDAITATYEIPDEKEIENRFRQFEESHVFFRSMEYPYALAAFSEYFKIAKFVGDFIEKNNDKKNDVAFDHAYKMLTLFFQDPKNLFKSIDEYLAKFINTENPLHDALVYSLPLRVFADRFDRPGWQAFIQNFGPPAMKIINNAIVIQQHVEGGKAPKTMDEARELLKKISFKNADRFPELAELCINYGVGEAIFEKCLQIRFPKEGVELKAHDRLPEVIINGEEVGHPGYCFVKLPKDDPRAFLLGQITGCCQSIGGHTEQCVIDSVTLENNGIYVLLKRKLTKSESDVKEIKETKSASPFLEPNKINYSAYDIVGQGYAWFSKEENLVIDSWENLTPTRDDPVIIPFLEKFAEKITKEPGSPLRVTIGRGGKTPAKWKEKQSVREDILTGFHYIDSHTQAVVFCNEERKKTYMAEIKSIFNAISIEKEPELDALITSILGNIYRNCNSELAFKEVKHLMQKIAPVDLKEFILHKDLLSYPEWRKMIFGKSDDKLDRLVKMAIENLQRANLIPPVELVNKMLTNNCSYDLAAAYIKLKTHDLHNVTGVCRFIYETIIYSSKSGITNREIHEMIKSLAQSGIMEDKEIREKFIKDLSTNLSEINIYDNYTKAIDMIDAFILLKEAKLEKEDSLRNLILSSSSENNIDYTKMQKAIAAFRAKKSATSDSKSKEEKSEDDLTKEYHSLLSSLNDHIKKATEKDSPGFFKRSPDEVNAMIALKQAIEKGEKISDVRDKYYDPLREAGILHIADRMNEILSSKENKIGSRPK